MTIYVKGWRNSEEFLFSNACNLKLFFTLQTNEYHAKQANLQIMVLLTWIAKHFYFGPLLKCSSVIFLVA